MSVESEFRLSTLLQYMVSFAEAEYHSVSTVELRTILAGHGVVIEQQTLEQMIAVLISKGHVARTTSNRVQLVN